MRSDLLHVVGVYFNPRRNPFFAPLARKWIAYKLECGVRLTVVEYAFGERPFEFNPAEFPGVDFVQIRGGLNSEGFELWLKEALIRIGFQDILRRDPDAKYLSWEDMDIFHADRNYAVETVHMLQHHAVGQTWVNSIDLDANGDAMPDEWGNAVNRSFSASWLAGDAVGWSPKGEAYNASLSSSLRDPNRKRDPRQHYGYSWAIRRDVLSGIGGLIDWLVTGSADYHMALGFAGVLDKTADPDATPGYRRRMLEFARRCDLTVKQNIGCVPGIIHAGYHGPKVNRHYLTRPAILKESRYDPDVDLAFDINGLPMLIGDNRVLRDGLARMFMRRNEV